MRAENEGDLRELLGYAPLQPVLRRLRDSYQRHGRPAGRLKLLTDADADAVGGIIGKRLRAGQSVAVADLDRFFREHDRFVCTLREALELHFGEPIISRRELREERDADWAQMRQRLRKILEDARLPLDSHADASAWIEEDRRVLRTWFTKWGEEKLMRSFRALAAALALLPGRDGKVMFLAELGSNAANDPHAFDLGRPAGALLNRALAHRYPELARRGAWGGASWRRSILAEAGIARDSISSRVDSYGLTGATPYLQALRESGLDRPFTLRTLDVIKGDVRAWRDVAFVVENPTVYEALLKRLPPDQVEHHPTLLCTNGNLNLADTALLNALVRHGAHLYYSGDFDPAGLEIAAMVLARYPGACTPWRMSADDYAVAIRREDHPFDPARLRNVAGRFPALVAAMLESSRTGDQEKLIDLLSADLTRFMGDGTTPAA
ncbi:MAG TPA: TIGR02679 family protein [Longimicrobium sp.]|nr:TIGR02679 family protein [Longimicrobium sp.]